MLNNSSAFGAGGPIIFADSDALTEPDKLLAAYFRSSTVGLCILDHNLRYLAVNNTLARINGVPAAEHIGKTVQEILGDLADIVKPQLRRVLSEGEPINLDVSAKLPSRTEPGHWSVHYIPIPNPAGVVDRLAAIVVEMTAQKQLEESLKQVGGNLHEQVRRLQMLLDVSGITTSNWNLEQVFPRVSARLRRVLRHEYAGFELHDPNTGLLIRQAEDFPLGKGLLSTRPISPHNSPGGRSLQERVPLIFRKDELQSFDSEITKTFLAEGLRSLCCVPLLRPKGPIGSWCWAARATKRFKRKI